MSVDEKRLRILLSKVAAKRGMKNWRYSKCELGETIENYGGFLIPVTVSGVDEDSDVTEHVFVKLPSLEETVRSLGGYWWDAEAYVYETLIPMWKRLSNVNLEELFPRCYYADTTLNNQALILKDMSYEGYCKYQEMFLDSDHVTVSLKSLAQFHALSVIMKNNQIKLDEFALRPYTPEYPKELNKALINSFRTHSQLFKGSKYENYFNITLLNYDKLLNESTSRAICLVYGHGDFWRENIMYKYKNKKPIKACIFDFQCCRLLSPARDFLFFILNGTSSSLRRLHYKKFYTEYYSTLKNTLLDNGIELEKFYSELDFKSDMKIVAPLCLIHICMAFSLWLGLETDALIKSKSLWANDQQREKQSQCLKEILKDAMQDLHDYGYIAL